MVRNDHLEPFLARAVEMAQISKRFELDWRGSKGRHFFDNPLLVR